uniref:Uncharacterized protein n=1 Tax=Anguilla anguilla TaxID=7936 RepID=A0A0E9UYB3_ANGAN
MSFGVLKVKLMEINLNLFWTKKMGR